jgi:hypothetical protein
MADEIWCGPGESAAQPLKLPCPSAAQVAVPIDSRSDNSLASSESQYFLRGNENTFAATAISTSGRRIGGEFPGLSPAWFRVLWAPTASMIEIAEGR